jgi:hypothetical protein
MMSSDFSVSLAKATSLAKAIGLFLILSAIGMSPKPSLGQDRSGGAVPVESQGGLSYSASRPTGDFSDALGDRTAQGIDLYAGVKAGSLPLYIGVDFDLGQYGSESRSVSFTGVDGTFETRSLLYQPQFSVRYQRTTGMIRPFAEGLVGANVLTTNTTWSDFGETVDAPESSDKTSATFNVGVGLGLDLRLVRVKPLGILGLTGSFHYAYGGEADVPVARGVAIDDSQVTTITTNTSVIQPEVGLYVEF